MERSKRSTKVTKPLIASRTVGTADIEIELETTEGALKLSVSRDVAVNLRDMLDAMLAEKA